MEGPKLHLGTSPEISVLQIQRAPFSESGTSRTYQRPRYTFVEQPFSVREVAAFLLSVRFGEHFPGGILMTTITKIL